METLVQPSNDTHLIHNSIINAAYLVGRSKSFFIEMQRDNPETFKYLITEADGAYNLSKEFMNYKEKTIAALYNFSELFIIIEEYEKSQVSRWGCRGKASKNLKRDTMWLEARAKDDPLYRDFYNKSFKLEHNNVLKYQNFIRLQDVIKDMAQHAHKLGLLEKYELTREYQKYLKRK